MSDNIMKEAVFRETIKVESLETSDDKKCYKINTQLKGVKQKRKFFTMQDEAGTWLIKYNDKESWIVSDDHEIANLEAAIKEFEIKQAEEEKNVIKSEIEITPNGNSISFDEKGKVVDDPYTTLEFKAQINIEGKEDIKTFTLVDEGKFGKIKVKNSTYLLSGSDRDKIKKAIEDFDARAYLTRVLWAGVTVEKLITHTCISDSGQYALDELVQCSEFKGNLCTKTKSEDGNTTTVSNGTKITFIVKKISVKKENDKKEVFWRIRYIKLIRKKPIIIFKSILAEDFQKDLELIYKAVDDKCKKLAEINSELTTKSLNTDPKKRDNRSSENSRYDLIAFPDYKKHKRKYDDEENNSIYQIRKFYSGENEHYCITTGLYCGVINLGKKGKLEIQTGYSDQLFKRMLLRCCGVFADMNTSDNSAESDQSIYSLIAQYLYLVSLRKVMGRIIPKRYEYLKDRGYNIRGNVDINEYINKDLILADKKISHIYPERVEIMNILIVLYAALKRCKKISGSNKILPKLSQFEGYLRETCCGKRPTRIMINNIHKEKCLKNNLYTDFNRPLDFAKIILKNDDTAPGDDTAKSGISGFLIDTSFLWEMYLYNVMRTKLSGWDVSDQTDIKMYEGMFYEKTNHPDFIVESTEQDSIFILDAKFKTMQFRKKDVDNKDIQQVHSYSYYYHLKEGDRFKGTALIYPYKKEFQTEKDKECKVSNMFGLPVENVKERFTILALQDNPDDLDQSENEFINDLMAFIENKTNETVDNQSGPK